MRVKGVGAGTALLYRMDTFHRGTPVKPGASRVTGHYVVKRASAEWMGSNSFIAACAAMPPSFVADLTLQQRAALAIPPPGHPYWTADTIAAVGRRHGEDMPALSICRHPLSIHVETHVEVRGACATEQPLHLCPHVGTRGWSLGRTLPHSRAALGSEALGRESKMGEHGSMTDVYFGCYSSTASLQASPQSGSYEGLTSLMSHGKTVKRQCKSNKCPGRGSTPQLVG